LQSDRRDEQAWGSRCCGRAAGEWEHADVCCAWSAGNAVAVGDPACPSFPSLLELARASPRANTLMATTVEVAGAAGTERRTRLPRLPYEEHQRRIKLPRRPTPSLKQLPRAFQSLLLHPSLQPLQYMPHVSLRPRPLREGPAAADKWLPLPTKLTSVCIMDGRC
jgi:hypothetical protein